MSTPLADAKRDMENPVYGDKKGATVEGETLVKTYPNGMQITFQIL